MPRNNLNEEISKLLDKKYEYEKQRRELKEDINELVKYVRKFENYVYKGTKVDKEKQRTLAYFKQKGSLKWVVGEAKCRPRDDFNEEVGKLIAVKRAVEVIMDKENIIYMF